MGGPERRTVERAGELRLLDVCRSRPRVAPQNDRGETTESGLDEPLDGSGRFAHHVLVAFRLLYDAMANVVVEKTHGHLLERIACCRYLREDIDAILVPLDHPLQTPHLALDAPQPGEDLSLVVVIASHRLFDPLSRCALAWPSALGPPTPAPRR